jgi:lipoprotein-anchoring transpeptidase ErfK/SrfK
MKRLVAALAAALLSTTLVVPVALAATPPPPAPVAPPAPPPGPPAPAAPGPGKQIMVVLGQEMLYAFQDGTLVGQTIVTSGGPNTRTPTGVYSVLQKRSSFFMSSPWPEDDWRWYAPSWVNYALLFQSSGYFLHDAPWRHNFGPGSNAQAGTAGGDYTGTHGCVNVPYQFEKDMFVWADIGTPVTVVA